MFHKGVYVIVIQFNELPKVKQIKLKKKSFTKLFISLHYGINAMYNECGTCNFSLVAKNPFTTHNIYQYVNKKQRKKEKQQCNQSK
jgi:hypothetical protein